MQPRLIGAAVAGLWLAAAPVLSAEVDQSVVPGSANRWNGSAAFGQFAQTFTAGKAGQLVGVSLAAFEISHGPDAGITIEIRKVVNGAPSNLSTDVLSSTFVNSSSVDHTSSNTTNGPTDPADYFYVDLSAYNIRVSVGDMLAIVLTGADGTGIADQGILVGSQLSVFDPPDCSNMLPGMGMPTYLCNGDYYGPGENWFRGGDIGYPDWTSLTTILPNAYEDLGFQTFVQPVNPAALLELLRKSVIGLGPGRSLVNKVALAQTYYAVPDINATCAVLTGFVHEVSAQTGKKLTTEQAASATSDAQAVMSAISCK
jgi:hypothetical protein